MSEQSAKHVSDKPKRTEDPQESIVQRIGRLYGAQTRVMVHDSPSESGPLLPKTDATEGPEDDSQYQILGFIAKGGVGEIYKARDKNLGREVALKVLRADRTETKHIAERLVEEAQVGSQLAHPGVVPVYGLGLQKDGRPHFAMKLIKGATLATLLQDRSAPGENRPELLSHFEQLCHTMAYCHARGVIHRDLKPANIMVGAFGEVLVVDWGFGKVLGLDARGRKKRPAEPTRNPVSVIATLRTTEEGSHSLAGSIMGTPAYMPPEQALGQVDELDERTDVFALGAVLCEILTGQPPYVGEPADVLVLAAQGRLDDAFARLDDCDADSALVELTKESLASVRAERPRHAGVVVERLLAHFAALDERARRAKVEAAKAHTVAEEQRARLEAERLQAEKERAKATEERIKGERALAAAEEQRRLNRWERQRQRRTILLAASILLALLVGGVSYLTVTSAERQRSEEQHAAFSKALSDAMELAGSQRWSEAAAAAEGAIPLIGPEQQHMLADVEGRIKTWRRNQARIEAEAAQVAKDRETLERIRELRASGAGRFDPAERDSAYAAAYREYGIEVERLEPKRAAAAIRDSMIAVELATALDDWVDLRRTAPALGDRDWKRLTEIAQEADPDPTRSRIRDELSRKGNLALAHMASSRDIDKQPARTLTQLAGALRSMGDAPGAVQILRRARARHPDDVWVNLELSTSLSALRPPRYAEAARYLRAALAVRPGSDQIRRSLGITLAAAGQWRGAAHTWRVLIAKSPDDPNLHAYLATALSRLGDLDGARSAAMRSLDLAPRNWLSWSTLLDVLALHADAEIYLVKCKEAAAAYPGDPTFVAHSARATARIGDHVKALALAEEALGREATNALACIVMGSLLLDRGDADRAVTVLQAGTTAASKMASNVQAAELERLFVRALEVTGELDKSKTSLQARARSNPGDVGARWGLAGVHRIQHHFADELQLRRRIAELAPYEPEAHRELGDHLRDHLGQYREAEAAYRRSIALRPQTARYHAALGRALALQGRTKESLEACERARQLDPLDFESRHAQVLVLNLARRKGEARKAAADAAEGAPDLCGPLVAAGAAQLEMGEFEGAQMTLEKAVAMAPRSPAAQLLLGRVRFRRADLAGAEEVLSIAVSQRPRDVRARLALAAVHEAQGKLEEALGGYRRVQSLARGFAQGYAGESWMRGRSGLGALSKPEDLLRLAQQAIDLDPRSGASWRALALAHLLAGEAEPASEACAQALAAGLDESAAAEVLFVRAMADARLKRETKARRWFQQGLGRLEKADGPARDREALRAQAAKLVGAEGN